MTRKALSILVWLLAAAVAPAWGAEFDHRAHLESYLADAECVTCHQAGAASVVPDTAVCQDCHDRGMLDGVVLREPRTHGPLWAYNHRAEAKGGSVDCAACHQQDYCLDCHKAGFADEQGAFGNNLANVHRSDFHVTHPLAARNDQTLCASCHEPKFCDDCHDTFRFRTGSIGSPSHRRTFDRGFEGVDIELIHGGIDNTQACDACHRESVEPDFHAWSAGHAREARRSLASCQACHPEGDVCLRCHSARSGVYGFNPHPKDWDDMRGTLRKASNGRTCRKCH